MPSQTRSNRTCGQMGPAFPFEKTITHQRCRSSSVSTETCGHAAGVPLLTGILSHTCTKAACVCATTRPNPRVQSLLSAYPKDRYRRMVKELDKLSLLFVFLTGGSPTVFLFVRIQNKHPGCSRSLISNPWETAIIRIHKFSYLTI